MNEALDRILQQCDAEGRLRRVVPFAGEAASDDDDVLFVRAYLMGRQRRTYLHKFYKSDARVHHNHPWDVSVSFILHGQYIDHRLDTDTGEMTSKLYGPGDVNVLLRDDFHFLELINEEPVYTLFFPGQRVEDGRDWGFWVPDEGFVPRLEYFSRR